MRGEGGASPASSEPLEAFAVAPPGFEDLVAAELQALGIPAVQAVSGGASFSGGWEHVYRANLRCRVASRVLVRAGRFRADSFRELESGLEAVDWPRWVPEASALRVRAAKHRTRLHHKGRIEELTRAVVGSRVSTRQGDPASPSLNLHVRVDGGRVTVSIDTSGDHLHRRGYRTEAGPAPMRENLAAGLLQRAGWTGTEPLLDPMCGSGTFAIEAGLLALGIPAGRGRAFAFERLPSFDPVTWEREQVQGLENARSRLAEPIFASDGDPGALSLAARAARRAGLADYLQIARAPLEALEPPARQGILVANPPYGRRLGRGEEACATLGRALRGPFRAWRWAVVVAGGEMERSLGLEPQAHHSFRSGGLRLRLAVGRRWSEDSGGERDGQRAKGAT